LRRLIWPLKFLPLRNSALFPLLEHLNSMLLGECAYIREAENQKDFYRLFRDEPCIVIPEVITYNDRAIVSRWVEGCSLRDYTRPGDGWFIETYLGFVLKSLANLGLVHADPHPGNFIINGDNTTARRLAVLDFGSVAAFSPEEVQAVSALLTGEYENEEQLINDLLILGINEESLDAYRPVLGDLVSILLEPFYYPGPYDFSNWRFQYRVNTLMASKTWEKPLLVSPRILLLARVLHGLYYYARKNSILFNWHDAVRLHLG